MKPLLCITTIASLFLGIGVSRAQEEPRPQDLYTEEEVLARFAHEPIVQDVQDAAVRYYMVHPEYIKDLRSRSLLKALVPQLSGEFNNTIGNVNRVMDDGLYPLFPFKEDERTNTDSMGFRVGAVWTLDRLVFNAELLDVQSLIGILDGVVREVTTIYYIRRRLQIDMILRPPPDLATRISQRIRVEELTGLLDAMTGSFMTNKVREGLERTRQQMMSRGGGSKSWSEQRQAPQQSTSMTYQNTNGADLSNFATRRRR